MMEAKRVTAPDDTELLQRISDTIRTLLPDVVKRELPQVPADAELVEDLGLTSFTLLELLLKLEDELDVQIDVEEIYAEHTGTVAALAAYVAGHMSVDQ